MTNTETGKPMAGKPRTWPKVLLALSLTLNLLVLGLVAGAHFRDGRDAARFAPPEREAARDAGFGPFLDALPRDYRGRVGEALRTRGGGMAADRDALVGELREMLAALRADPYEPAVLEDLLGRQHARITARVELGREVMLEQIAAMSPGERAEFADRLEHGFRRGLERAPH